jgi:type IV pilus assembly protein PilQ
LHGCASHKAAEGKAEGKKRITEIITHDDVKSTTVTISGNQMLTYTSIKQVFPLGVLFHFPETALDNIQTDYTPADDTIITTIKATEIKEEDETTTSRIFISLKKDVPYDITPGDSGLHIAFPKTAVVAAATESSPAEQESSQPVVKKSATEATRIKSVAATPLQKNIVINVSADGTIKNFKSFTIDNPPRIVIDLYKIKSPYSKEQRIAVKSKWLNQVRHFGHPDKVRVVLDTHKPYLSKYSITPVDSGLLIHVGTVPAKPAKQAQAPMVAQTPESAELDKEKTPAEKQPAPKTAEKKEAEVTTKKYDKPAWVNRIDFSSEEDGKSALIIGTTRPVKYEIKKVAAKRVQLRLFDTNLPEYRKRALITTRFESAVDRVTPMQPAKKNESWFSIEMREAVPYVVSQKDNVIRVNFSPSKIPPKPYEDADLPAWKKVLAEGEAAPATAEKPVPAAKQEAGAPQKQPATAEKPVPAAKQAVLAPKKQPAGFPGPPKDETIMTEPPLGEGIDVSERKEIDFDIESQKRVDLYTGEERQVDIYGERIVRRYTGEPIALDFYETDIKNVFRILKEISGKNFAVDKNVTGKVTLALEEPVPWDQVLDLVLKMNQLGRIWEGNIIRIATLKTLELEEKQRRLKLEEEKKRKRQEALITAFYRINYADAQTVMDTHIRPLYEPREGAKEKERGSVTVDTRLNMIIVTGTPSLVKRAKEIINRIDLVTPQVVIEARVVEANSTFSRDLGFDWGTTTLGEFALGDTLSIGPTTFRASNLPEGDPTAVLGFNFATLGKATPFEILNAQLVASEVEGITNILSAPKVVTLNNVEATIKQGFEVPYLERDSSGNATVRFKDVDLLLKVTPQVTFDNRVALDIFVTKNDIVDPTAPQPALSTNEASTKILMDDGETIVIGGILKSTQNWAEDRIPGLGKLPGLGWLFKAQERDDDKNELLIFITPQIVYLEQQKL